ncbi:MAG: hypothetical protein MRK02_04225 [Candidatus Scalindua sp.]|nr:hypothetical protein [Candidatus Scalindua sp.]
MEALGEGVKRHSVDKATKDDKYAYVLRHPDLSLGARGSSPVSPSSMLI